MAIFVAVEISVPAAVCSLVMVPFTTLWGMSVSRQVATQEQAAVS